MIHLIDSKIEKTLMYMLSNIDVNCIKRQFRV